ncbi:hypothetical protein GF373_12355, partial [bacterium]|nr:hypothetical protein [bacterium]
MLGLFAAALARKSLIGYVTGFAALGLSYIGSIAAPLEFLTYSLKNQYNNLRFLEEANWLVAKIVFLGLSFILFLGVLHIVHTPRKQKWTALGMLALLLITYTGLHAAWIAKPSPNPDLAAPAVIVEMKQKDDRMHVVTAQSKWEWEHTRKKETTDFTLHQYQWENGQWKKEKDMLYPGPSAAFKLIKLSIEAKIHPASKTIDATATLTVSSRAKKTDTLYF